MSDQESNKTNEKQSNPLLEKTIDTLDKALTKNTKNNQRVETPSKEEVISSSVNSGQNHSELSKPHDEMSAASIILDQLTDSDNVKDSGEPPVSKPKLIKGLVALVLFIAIGITTGNYYTSDAKKAALTGSDIVGEDYTPVPEKVTKTSVPNARNNVDEDQLINESYIRNENDTDLFGAIELQTTDSPSDSITLSEGVSLDAVTDNASALDYGSDSDQHLLEKPLIPLSEPVEPLGSMDESTTATTIPAPPEEEPPVIIAGLTDGNLSSIRQIIEENSPDLTPLFDSNSDLQRRLTEIKTLLSERQQISLYNSIPVAPTLTVIAVIPASKGCELCTAHATIRIAGTERMFGDGDILALSTQGVGTTKFTVSITADRFILRDELHDVDFSYWKLER
ncbi:MAG: hypothetical protein V3T17_09840 [Pseudomonadales bacterium]